MAEPRKPDMAALFGPPGAGKSPPGGSPKMGAMPSAEEPLPPDFESAASEFLDAARSPEERMHALKRAIEACVDAREGGEYEPEPGAA